MQALHRLRVEPGLKFGGGSVPSPTTKLLGVEMQDKAIDYQVEGALSLACSVAGSASQHNTYAEAGCRVQ